MRAFLLLSVWDIFLGRTPKLTLYEDNPAAAQIVRTGKSQRLRHVRRTHGISIPALRGWNQTGVFTLADCHTKAQAADVFTKGFVKSESWDHAVALIGMVDGPCLKRFARACPAPRAQGGASVSLAPSKGGPTPAGNKINRPDAEFTPFKAPAP